MTGNGNGQFLSMLNTKLNSVIIHAVTVSGAGLPKARTS